MKLFKRLLPIATASAAAVAAITPLATSCGTNADYDFITDGSSIYIPTIERAKADWSKYPEGYTRVDAEALYFESIATNPEIYYQDIKATLSCAAYYFVNDSYYAEANFGVSLSNIEIDAKNRTVSVSGKFDFHARNIGMALTKDIRELNGDLELEFEMSTMPYALAFNKNAKLIPFSGWCFAPGMPINNENKMSINVWANGCFWAEPIGPASFCEFNDEEITVDDEKEFEKLDIKWIMALALVGFSSGVLSSYHLANIIPAEGPDNK